MSDLDLGRELHIMHLDVYIVPLRSDVLMLVVVTGSLETT